MEEWVCTLGLGFICPESDRLLDLGPDALLFVCIINGIVVFWKSQQDFSIVIHKPRMPCLKEQRAGPGILPVDKTRDLSPLNEDIWSMDIPMPDGRSDLIPFRQ